ncbi:hypothetical protein [Phormidium sp. CCY1219]|jgi:hypothetical protein|nr:hypothetical protein [Phormidium sp. CCY1219]
MMNASRLSIALLAGGVLDRLRQLLQCGWGQKAAIANRGMRLF